MESADSRVGVLKVFKTKHSYHRPGNHNLPMILMVRFKKGAHPQYASYKVMRQEFPELLLDYFQKRIVLREGQSQGKPLQENQKEQFVLIGEKLRQSQKQSSTKEVKVPRSIKSRKSSPRREHQSQQHSLSADSRPLRSCRLKNQLTKENPRQLRRYQHEKEENQISERMEEYEKSVAEKVSQQPENKLNKILDYDYQIEELACLNLISPAVIPPIKPKHDTNMQNPPAYQLPPRISFNEPQHYHFSSEEYKQSDSSEFLLDERGKEKRRREKLLREQQKMSKKKRIKKIKTKGMRTGKGKGKMKGKEKSRWKGKAK